MPTQQESSVYWSDIVRSRAVSTALARPSVCLAHLGFMEHVTSSEVRQLFRPEGVALGEPALSMVELAAELSVKCQALYDLRSQGRGPRGFRVGRKLRFRRSEIVAWLERMEHEDDQRCHGGGH